MSNPKRKILLIEDDSFLLSMYTTKFELENFIVVTAEDGEKGFEMVMKEAPDIILLDIILPKMSGFEVLKKIKSDDELKKIPVILLTNLSQKSDIEKGLGLNADDYIIKAHFTPAEVVEKAKKVLSK